MDQDPVLSCIQPTGELHFGNYFGAIANWVKLQRDYRCIYGVVDLHAMTMPYEPEALRRNTQEMIIDLMACGINPDLSILFVQSLVPEHTELCWILSCFCSYGDLTRQTQFKDKATQLEESARPETADEGSRFLSAGLFVYPVLQAADILVYQAQYVPVGRDQQQHLELSRNIARRFNHRFGETFPLPEALFTETPRIQSLADPTKKMSKGLGPKHYIGLFEEPDSIRAKVNAAVTDSGGSCAGGAMSPGVENLFQILDACGKDDEHRALREAYDGGDRTYSHVKSVVADALIDLSRSFRERRNELMKDQPYFEMQTRLSSERAREAARETLRRVRTRVGLPPR